MSDSDKEKSLGSELQSFFQAEKNLITIALGKDGTVVFHYGNDSGGVARDPAWAEVVMSAARQLSEIQRGVKTDE